jgi:hypothetical protein
MVLMSPDPDNPGEYLPILKQPVSPLAPYLPRLPPPDFKKITIENYHDLMEYFRKNNWQKPGTGRVEQQMIYDYLNTVPEKKRDKLINYIERKIPGYDPYTPVVPIHYPPPLRPCTTGGPGCYPQQIGVNPVRPLVSGPVPGHDFPLVGVNPVRPLVSGPVPGHDFPRVGVNPVRPLVSGPVPGRDFPLIVGEKAGPGLPPDGWISKPYVQDKQCAGPGGCGGTQNFNPLTTNLVNQGTVTTIGKYGGKKKGKAAHKSSKKPKKESVFYGI